MMQQQEVITQQQPQVIMQQQPAPPNVVVQQHAPLPVNWTLFGADILGAVMCLCLVESFLSSSS